MPSTPSRTTSPDSRVTTCGKPQAAGESRQKDDRLKGLDEQVRIRQKSGQHGLFGLRRERDSVNAIAGASARAGGSFAGHAFRSLKLLVTTLTLLTAIAAAASAGVSWIPNKG